MSGRMHGRLPDGGRRGRRARAAGRVAVGAVAVALLALAPTAASTAATPPPPSCDPAPGIREAEYWLDDYGIRAAWQTTRGAGQVIAVIDTGVDPTVAELQGAVLPGADFSGQGDGNGWTPVGPADEREHGTLVASMAAGRGTGPDAGMIGVAPEAEILPISIGFGDDSDSDDAIASAVRFAVDHGATVINMSLTRNTLEWPKSWDDAFLYAMDHDVVIVAAAGNRGSGTTVVGAPATMPGVLTVAGVDQNGAASYDASSQGITIGVAAPSECLVGVAPGGGYRLWSGTSGAAPLVAGIVALVRASHPGLDADDVIERIVATAKDAGAPGQDAIYGWGLVDAENAVTASVPHVDANPMGSLEDWVKLYRPTANEPEPVPTPVVIIPSAPQAVAGDPTSPTGRLLPSLTLLRTVGVGALAIGLFVAGLILLGVWAVRRIEAGRRSR